MLNSLFNNYNRLCHFIVAKPIDILHSPFVFKLYQDAVSIKRNQSTNQQLREQLVKLNCKKAKAISEILTALNATSIFILNQIQGTWVLTSLDHSAIKYTFDELAQHSQQIDAVYLADNSLLHKIPLAGLKSLLNNHCPLIIDKPHANAITHQHWHELYHNNEIQIAIDFFDIGLCFFNRKQAKEFFKLRLW